MDLSAFDALPIGEKLRLVERLWDDIGASGETLPLPEWVTTEARRRLDEMKSDPDARISEEEMWRRFRDRRDR